MTMFRRTKALRHGILAALAGPSDLILAVYEKPLTYRKFSIDDAWHEVGDYLEQGIRHFERQESRERAMARAGGDSQNPSSGADA